MEIGKGLVSNLTMMSFSIFFPCYVIIICMDYLARKYIPLFCWLQKEGKIKAKLWNSACDCERRGRRRFFERWTNYVTFLLRHARTTSGTKYTPILYACIVHCLKCVKLCYGIENAWVLAYIRFMRVLITVCSYWRFDLVKLPTGYGNAC